MDIVAATEVQFAKLVQSLLSIIGDEEKINLAHHSVGNFLAEHSPGEWTYELDNAHQITLRYWCDSLNSIPQGASETPIPLLMIEDVPKLTNALRKGVKMLKAKVAQRRDSISTARLRAYLAL